jgi:hypothetical protein
MLKGQHHTNKSKIKISQSMSKFLSSHKVNSYRFRNGNIPWNKGKIGIYSKEHIEKIRNSHLGSKNHFFGKHHTKESKIMMGVKGRVISIETKEKLRNGRLGKHHSLESRKIMSLVHKGERSYLWKGGISFENKRIRASIEFRIWREAVFARDNWTCQKCKIRGGVLHPHHIKSFAEYPKLRFEIDNGQTLCKKCHKRIHKDCRKALEKLGCRIKEGK